LKQRQIDFDRVLIDWADEFIQDLVASFSARRPTIALRMAVLGLYLFAAFHLIFAALLPFYRDAIGGVIGVGTSHVASDALTALANGIVIGSISYHLLLTVAYVLLSFVVRAARRWTILAGTFVLGVNVAVALNGLRTPNIGDVFAVLQWITLILGGSILLLLWSTALAPSPSANRLRDTKAHLSNERA
jgi:hypothetical protein